MNVPRPSDLDCADVPKPTPASSVHGRWRSMAFPVIAGSVLWANAALGAGTQLVQIIPIPGAPLASYDISWVDPTRHHYYLADRSNAGVDIFDTRTNEFVGRVGGFVGFTGSNDTSGPDGLVGDGDRLYAGNGDSTLKVIDVDSMQIINSVSTGGAKRVDEWHWTRPASDCSSPTTPTRPHS